MTMAQPGERQEAMASTRGQGANLTGTSSPLQPYVRIPLWVKLQVQHWLANDVRGILPFCKPNEAKSNSIKRSNTRTYHEAHNTGLPPRSWSKHLGYIIKSVRTPQYHVQ